MIINHGIYFKVLSATLQAPFIGLGVLTHPRDGILSHNAMYNKAIP